MSTTVGSVPQGPVVQLGIPDSVDIPRLVYCAPYFQQVPLAELIEPSVQESVEALLPSLVPPYVQAAADAAVQQLAVLKTGSTMSGPLMLAPLMPTADSMAATKAYVDTMVATAGVPEVPAVPIGQTWARQTGQWIPLDPSGGAFLPLAGGTMQGIINMSGYAINNLAALPNMPNGAAPANWVLQQIASVSLYQGTWNMDTYVPDLTNPNTHVNGYTWIAITASTSGVVIAPPIPGLQGLTVFNGDTIIWSNIQGQFNRIHSGGLSLAEAQALFLPFTGGTMTGPLLAFENPTEAMEVATMGWVQSLIPTGGIIPAPPTDGQVYGRNGLTASWIPVLPLAGGVLTGPIMLSGNATNALSPVPLQQLTSTLTATYMPLAGGTMTGPIVLSGNASANLNPVPLQQLNAMIGSYLPLSGGNVSGSLGVGGAAAAGMVAGGLFANQQVFSLGYGLNTYLNAAATGWVYMNANLPMTINATALMVDFNVAPAGTAGSAATGFVTPLTLLPTGTVYVAQNTSASFGVGPSPSLFYLTDNGTYRLLNFAANAALECQISTGIVSIQMASGNTQFAPSGVVTNSNTLQAPRMMSTASPNFGFYSNGSANIYAYSGNSYWQWSNTSADLSYQGPNAQVTFQRVSDSAFIIPNQGYKPGGGVWADSASDSRVKTIKGVYTKSLAAIAQLAPQVYTFLGNETTEAPAAGETAPYRQSGHHIPALQGIEYIGLVADDVMQVFPECVTERSGYIDGNPVTDIKQLDTTPLLFAIINALGEISTRLTALDGKQAT